jgi:hypothetical protein
MVVKSNMAAAAKVSDVHIQSLVATILAFQFSNAAFLPLKILQTHIRKSKLKLM